jgi:hypothetical protein
VEETYRQHDTEDYVICAKWDQGEERYFDLTSNPDRQILMRNLHMMVV